MLEARAGMPIQISASNFALTFKHCYLDLSCRYRKRLPPLCDGVQSLYSALLVLGTRLVCFTLSTFLSDVKIVARKFCLLSALRDALGAKLTFLCTRPSLCIYADVQVLATCIGRDLVNKTFSQEHLHHLPTLLLVASLQWRSNFICLLFT